MKRFFTLVCLVLCAFTLAVISFAHPGDTDGGGGHYNHDTGEYHYHHGYHEHQHPDGICPYSYGDTTSESTTLFSLEDFTFEYKEFTPIVPEYPSIGDYTSPVEKTTEEHTEIDYNSQNNNNTNSTHRTGVSKLDAGDVIVAILFSLVVALAPSFALLLFGIPLPKPISKHITDKGYRILFVFLYFVFVTLIFISLL